MFTQRKPASHSRPRRYAMASLADDTAMLVLLLIVFALMAAVVIVVLTIAPLG